MSEYRTKLNEDGRIFLPAELRRHLHLEPGQELILRLDKEEIRIFTIKRSLKKAQNLVKKYSNQKSLVKKLKKMRQEDDNE